MKDGLGADPGEAMRVDGIVAGTRIATGTGWRAVQSLQQGDDVLTLEAGYQPLAGLWSARLPGGTAPPEFWPVAVPQGALDCREALLLLPDQKVLIECDQAEALFGDALALVPASALEGWRGISRVSHVTGARAVTLVFAAPQVIYASCAVLLACPGQSVGAADLFADRPPRLAETALTGEQARHLVACLIAEDLGSALRG